MAQTPGFYPTPQVKTCFLTARCLMSLIGSLASTEKMVPEGRLHMRPFQFHLKEHWKFPHHWTAFFLGQKPSLHTWLVAESCKHDERLTLSSQRPQYPTLYRCLKRRLGLSLRTKFYTRSVVSPGKRASHKRPRIKNCLSGLETLQRPVSGPTVLVATDNSTVVASINKQGGTHSVEICALLWRIMTWSHHSHITLKARHIPRCLNVMADLLSRSNQVQSTEWSLHPQVYKQICQRWFTPHLSEPQGSTVRVSYPRPEGSKHKLDGSHCLCLPSNGSPSQGDPKHQAMQLSDHTNSPRLARDALVLGPSAALNRDPTAAPGVDNSPQAVPQLHVPQQPQHLNLHAWCLGVDNSKNKASL